MTDDNGDKVNFKQYFDLAIKAQSDKTDAIIKGQQLALELAKQNMDYRLEEMNNFRRDMQKMENSFLTREAYEGKHEALVKEIDSLKLSRAELQGKASQSAVNIAMAVSVIGIVISLMNAVIHWLRG